MKEEGRGCVYWEEGTHHAGLSQAHGQAETSRHGERQQGAEARAHSRVDHTQAADNSFYNQFSGEGSQGLHFWRNCRAGLAQGMDEDSVCFLHGEAVSESGAGSRAGSEQANKRSKLLKPSSALAVQGVSRAATGELGSVVSTASAAQGLRLGADVSAGVNEQWLLGVVVLPPTFQWALPSVQRSISCVCARAHVFCVCVCARARACWRGGTDSDFLTHSFKATFIL